MDRIHCSLFVDTMLNNNGPLRDGGGTTSNQRSLCEAVTGHFGARLQYLVICLIDVHYAYCSFKLHQKLSFTITVLSEHLSFKVKIQLAAKERVQIGLNSFFF